MLQFFSASTNIVNSKRAITECLENALQGEPDLNCDLIIIYSAMGHNFKDLVNEACKISPGARIVGCTCPGIIGINGADESMKALAIMAVKGQKDEFAITDRKEIKNLDPYEMGVDMARELKGMNPSINMIHFLPDIFEWLPMDRAIEGIKSVFGNDIPIFGGLSMDNFKFITSYHFIDNQVVERGAVMIGYADPSLKIISQANHGYQIIEGMTLIVTKSKPGCIYEINGQPSWKLLTDTLGVPENAHVMEVNVIASFAKELPAEFHVEYGSKYSLFAFAARNEDNSINVGINCQNGMPIWITKRDEKKMFDGVDWMLNKILDKLDGKKPVAVFHADCALRGRFSLNRILKDEIINRIQSPLTKGENIPWLGLYSGGEFGMIGGQTWFHQLSTSLSVLYR